MGNFGVLDSYKDANLARVKRADWHELPVKTCIDPTCKQRFRQEVYGQTHCRDCHSLHQTGFYAPEIEDSHRTQTRINLLDSISILQVRQYLATNTTALYILVHAAQYLELQYHELMDQD